MRSRCSTLLLATAACSGVFGPDPLDVTIEPIADVYPHDGPFAIAVTAINRGDREIVWGRGSSSCQLDLHIQVDGRHFRLDNRICTADFAPQGLGPGEERTETFLFEGAYRDGDSLVSLAPGAYRLRGAAGDRARSDPAVIAVEAVN